MVKTAKASIQPRRKYFDILKPNAITRALPDYSILCSLSIHVINLRQWIRVKHSEKSKAKRIRKEKDEHSTVKRRLLTRVTTLIQIKLNTNAYLERTKNGKIINATNSMSLTECSVLISLKRITRTRIEWCNRIKFWTREPCTCRYNLNWNEMRWSIGRKHSHKMPELQWLYMRPIHSRLILKQTWNYSQYRHNFPLEPNT